MDPYSAINSDIDDAYLLTFKSIREAETAARACLKRSGESDYQQGILSSRILLALVDIYKGLPDQAMESLSEIIEDGDTGFTEDIQMRYYHARGLYFLNDGVYRDAFDSFVKCGNLAARTGNLLFQILSANGKGVIKLDQLEFEDAYNYFHRAQSELAGSRYPLINTLLLLNTGCALGGMERYRESLEQLNRALKESEEQDALILKSSILDETATVLVKQNRLEEALPVVEQGYRVSRELLHHEAVTEVIYNYASLLLRLGETDKAESLINGMGNRGERQTPLMLYHKVAGEIHEQQGDLKKALDSYKAVLEIREQIQGEEVLQSVFRQEIEELKKQNSQLRLVGNIGQELVSTLDLGQIFNLIYAQMNALMPVDHLSVGTLEGEKINIKFSLNAGEPLEPFSIPKDNPDSFISYCVRTGEEIFIRNVEEEYQRYTGKIVPFKANRDRSLRSLICIPLEYGGVVDGFMTVQSFTPYAYSRQDLDNLRALSPYVGIAVRNALQTEKMTELNKVLRYQSVTDSLTGLVTRREFISQGENILRVSRRNHFPASVIIIDLDYFKEINDRYGHGAGDEVLSKFGSLLKNYFQRPLDCTCRHGGEEFLVLAGNMDAVSAARRIHALRQEFSAWDFGDHHNAFHANFSCGIYSCSPEGDSSEYIGRIISMADKFLYLAKKDGRKCTYLSDELNKPAEKFIPRETEE